MKKVMALLMLIMLILGNVGVVFADDENEELDYSFVYEDTVDVVSDSTKEPDILSRNVVILDRDSKQVLWGKNENTKVPMASTTKIMTAILVIENGKLNETVEVDKKAAAIGGSRLGLKTGDKISMHDLLYGLMLCSRK